jgi:hypothetical protein
MKDVHPAMLLALLLHVSGATFDVPDDPAVAQWIESSARSVAAYYGGKFPVAQVRITVEESGDDSIHGTTYPSHHIRLRVPRKPDYADDWVAIHEMLHLCFPSLPDAQHWMEEGLSTYVEPLAQVRGGRESAGEAWHGFLQGMRNGEPREGDRGLDRTHTWGRTYWGGATFWLMADFEIRRRTSNAKGLPDALIAIAKNGGTIENDWTVEKVIEVGDQATGTHVLRELYAKMKDASSPMDFDALWTKLGVSESGLDDKAPLANLRKAMMGEAK